MNQVVVCVCMQARARTRTNAQDKCMLSKHCTTKHHMGSVTDLTELTAQG